MLRSLMPAAGPVPGVLSWLALAAGLGLAACGPGPDAPRRAATPQTQPQTLPEAAGRNAVVNPQRPVTVALLAPLGAAAEGAAAGQAIVDAARMAMTDLSDPALTLSVHDTRATPDGARAAAEAAVAEGAALILGPLFGKNARGVGEVARRAGINAVSFSNDSSVAGGPVFVSGFLPENEAERIVGYAASQGHDRLAVFHPDTGYGRAGLRGAERAAGTSGARVVTSLGYPRSFEGIQNSAGSFSSAAMSAGANAVLIPDSDQALRSAVAFLDYGGLDPARVRYLGLGQWDDPATLREAALEGGWFPSPDPNRFDSFARLYAQRHGQRPPLVAVLGYDGVQIAGQLLSEARQAGSRTPFGRAELTRSRGFQGVLGPVRFEPDGSNRRAMAVLEVGAEEFRVIDPAPQQIDLLF